MKLYTAVYTCTRDEYLSAHKAENLDGVGCERPYHFFYGHPAESLPDFLDRRASLPTVLLGCNDNYENQALKTFALCKHALETDETWTHLLKTDVNRDTFFINWDMVEQSDYAGMVVHDVTERTYGIKRMSEPILREAYQGPIPRYYAGGCAYIISRKLAQHIVAKGAWYARGFTAEDMYVGMVAEEFGIPLVAAISYYEMDGLPSGLVIGGPRLLGPQQKTSLDHLYRAASEDRYAIANIYAHVPKLRDLASQCDTVVEFGLQHGVSTSAILAAQPRVFVSYDLWSGCFWKLFDAHKEKTDFRYVCANVEAIDIPECDMLFCDADNTAIHVHNILTRHHDKVRKWIVFHDTTDFGEVSEWNRGPGINPAIRSFLKDKPKWHVVYHVTNCGGLTVLSCLPDEPAVSCPILEAD